MKINTVIKNERGASFSLTEMMIAVVISAILFGAVFATLVSVIPWFQNEQTKSNLQSIVDVQEPHRIIYGKYLAYEDLSGVDSKYINIVDPATNNGEWWVEVPQSAATENTHKVMRQVSPAEIQQLRNPRTVSPPTGVVDDSFLLSVNDFVADGGVLSKDTLLSITNGHSLLAGSRTSEYDILNSHGCYLDNETQQYEPATRLAGDEYLTYMRSSAGAGFIKSSIIASGSTKAVESLTNAERTLISETFPVRSDSLLVEFEGFTPSVCQ